MDLKKIAGIAFGISFLMAIVLFTDYGRQYISFSTARLIFIITGAIALLLNLLSFKSGKHNPIFSFIYWAGSLIVFIGLTFLVMRLPYGYYIVVTGIIILGVSFVFPSNWVANQKDQNDLLDN